MMGGDVWRPPARRARTTPSTTHVVTSAGYRRPASMRGMTPARTAAATPRRRPRRRRSGASCAAGDIRSGLASPGRSGLVLDDERQRLGVDVVHVAVDRDPSRCARRGPHQAHVVPERGHIVGDADALAWIEGADVRSLLAP